MESPLFCYQIHIVNAQTRSSNELKSRGSRKSPKRMTWQLPRENLATTACAGHHGWTMVASSWFCPAVLHFGASSYPVVLVVVHLCWVLFGPSCKLLSFVLNLHYTLLTLGPFAKICNQKPNKPKPSVIGEIGCKSQNNAYKSQAWVQNI